ncbi:MAG TPA: glycosyltransferase [Caldimonas sp.]|jgi:UDP-N-acetylmuramyl pentapeptide phosphotransferase/UDP-N-acetylglucosamine-1-phosphate transferase|nr:glycosyltransferase [Caldimonas sp.]HEX2542311.1 glycosyltransferase [Caldimonas sp.]
MSLFILSFLASLFATLAVVRSSAFHARISADHDFSGPQKFHASPVPRIGGIGVVMAMAAGGIAAEAFQSEGSRGLWLILVCAAPAFIVGIAEDLTKKVAARWRLLATALSAVMAVWLLEAVLPRTHIPGVDTLMTMWPFAVALTLLCVTGVANAVNIIDGFNGLASMCVMMMMLAIAYVAFQVNDVFVAQVALISAGAILGFFVWNFPAGLIFLGDGGAYFIGFVLAELSVLLIARNESVSPLFPLLVCAYPIFETIFTMYRRRVLRGAATAAPDGIHLHTLIHRRLIRTNLASYSNERRQTVRNSMTSPYLWLLCLLSIIPSLLWWNSTQVLAVFLLLFIGSYVFLYWRIVRFKTPRWLGNRR